MKRRERGRQNGPGQRERFGEKGHIDMGRDLTLRTGRDLERN